jgi:hypothetical protein
MRRIGIVSLILGLLIVADGIYQQVVQYNDGETQNLLNLKSVTLTDGVTLIISGAEVLIVALLALVLASRSPQTPQTKQ